MLRTKRGNSKGRHAQKRSVCLLPVLLDEELPFAGGCGASVLTLPLGTQTVLAHLIAELSDCKHRAALIVTEGEADRYERCLPAQERSGYRVVTHAQVPEVLASCETSDYLMIVQARYWPVVGHDMEHLARLSARFRGATHSIAVGRQATGARERLECDANGQVRRVQRLYDHMSWPEAAASRIMCTLVPSHALNGLDICSPARLRAELAARGVLTHDVPIGTDVADLTQPSGILSLNERMIEQTLRQTAPVGYSLRGENVLMSDQSRIHPSARVIGPVLLQHGAVVEEGAQIIGPAVLGEGSKVGRNTVVARSVLGAGAILPAGATASQQVVVGPGQMSNNDSALDESASSNGHQSFAVRSTGTLDSAEWNPAEQSHRSTLQRVVKRSIDIVAALVGLVALSPLFVVVAALVKFTSPGPVFFLHRREGKDGVEFPCIKFRSMVADAHRKQRDMYSRNEVDGPQFKLAVDPRETRIGRILRKTNIDELPQLFNVLVGQMSLVGPRPSPFRENQICVAWRRARLSVRPGITGLWQLCRDRNSDSDFHQWIYYDLAYVRHFSLMVDIKVLIMTVLTWGGRRRVALSSLIEAAEELDKSHGSQAPGIPATVDANV